MTTSTPLTKHHSLSKKVYQKWVIVPKKQEKVYKKRTRVYKKLQEVYKKSQKVYKKI